MSQSMQDKQVCETSLLSPPHQIDNQLFDAYFPTVLNVLPIPKAILKKTGPRPFIEMSLLRRQVPENDMDTVK